MGTESWRPEGWENPCGDDNLTGQSAQSAFEAGADAMLEALKKNEIKELTISGCKLPIPSGIKLYFIPDEVDK
jgi:hypothetical protein